MLIETENYPKIGSIVNFVRQIQPTGEIHQGMATVHAICLDPEKRIMAHLSELKNDGQELKFNVDINCVNPSDEFVTKFAAATDRVRMLSEEGNKLAQKVIEDYNGLVAEAYSDILGKPVEFKRLNPVVSDTEFDDENAAIDAELEEEAKLVNG